MTKRLCNLKWYKVDNKETRAHYEANLLWPFDVRSVIGAGLYATLGSFAQMYQTQKAAQAMTLEDSVSFFVMMILGRLNRFIETRRDTGDPYPIHVEDFIVQQLNNLDKEQHIMLYEEMWAGVKYEYARYSSCSDDDAVTHLKIHTKQQSCGITPSVESEMSMIYDAKENRHIKREFPFD